jgi:hypothetical protein
MAEGKSHSEHVRLDGRLIIILLLPEHQLCYCGEIRQMFTLHTNLYCPKAYLIPGHSLHDVECYGIISKPKFLPGLEHRTFMIL